MTADNIHAHAPVGFRDLAAAALDRADRALTTAIDASGRLMTHEATDRLTHDALNARVKAIETEQKRATYGLIVMLASLIGTVIAKGHLF